MINRFLWQGSQTVAYWNRKYAELNGFNRFLSGQGYSQLLPLPKEKPRITRPFVPYVLNHYELARFFEACLVYVKRDSSRECSTAFLSAAVWYRVKGR